MAGLKRRTLLRGVAGLGVAGVAGVGGLFAVGVGSASCAHQPITAFGSVRGRFVDGVRHIGNSTHLITLDGVAVLTDPWLVVPADHIFVHSVPPAPLPVDVDVVLITHEHEDHFDPAALALVNKGAVVVCPVWLAVQVRRLGFADVRGVQPGDIIEDAASLRIDVVRALHDIDEVVYRFGGKAEGARRIFFGGDSMPTPDIHALADDGGCDLAILPADGSSLLGTRRVMNVEEAIALAHRFGVNRDGAGAMLSHHEFALTSPVWGAIVDVSAVDVGRLPAWFTAPTPGMVRPFPWMG